MTDPLLALPRADRNALEDHLSRLRHDLGKYVSLQVRWLGEGAPADELARALAADLLETRRGPNGTLDAHTVWGEFRPALVGEQALDGGVRVDLSEDRDFAALDRAMDEVARVSAALRAGGADEATVASGVAAAGTVSGLCRRLWTRVRGG